MQTVKNFLNRIWYWRKTRKFNQINKQLIKAVKNKAKKQRALKIEIMKDIREYLGIDKNDMSKFIPYDYKTRIRVKTAIAEKHGEQMTNLNVQLSDKLILT